MLAHSAHDRGQMLICSSSVCRPVVYSSLSGFYDRLPMPWRYENPSREIGYRVQAIADHLCYGGDGHWVIDRTISLKE
jgi:hypothetical protein